MCSCKAPAGYSTADMKVNLPCLPGTWYIELENVILGQCGISEGWSLVVNIRPPVTSFVSAELAPHCICPTVSRNLEVRAGGGAE